MAGKISINLGGDNCALASVTRPDEGVTVLTLDLAGEWGVDEKIYARIEVAYGPLEQPLGHLVTAQAEDTEDAYRARWVGDGMEAFSVAASFIADLVGLLADAAEDATGGWADPRPECERTQLGAITGTEGDDCDGDDLAPLKMGA